MKENEERGEEGMIEQPKGLGKWLMKTHRSIRRTEQELEVRDMLGELGLEYEEQYAVTIGEEVGRPGVKLEEGVRWLVVDFLVKSSCGKQNGGKDIIIECARLTMGKTGSHRKMMERVRQRAYGFELRFFEIKRYYRDVVCTALIEAPERDIAGYIKPRIPSADVVVDSINGLKDVLIRFQQNPVYLKNTKRTERM